jgi:hypothetical protein
VMELNLSSWAGMPVEDRKQFGLIVLSALHLSTSLEAKSFQTRFYRSTFYAVGFSTGPFEFEASHFETYAIDFSIIALIPIS